MPHLSLHHLCSLLHVSDIFFGHIWLYSIIVKCHVHVYKGEDLCFLPISLSSVADHTSHLDSAK